MKAVPSGVVGRTTINSCGFCRGASDKVKEELVASGFLVKDSLCMAPCNDIDFAHFCLKKIGVKFEIKSYGTWKVKLTMMVN